MKIDYTYSKNQVNFFSNIVYKDFKHPIIFKNDSLKLLGIFPGTKYYFNDLTPGELLIHENRAHPLMITFPNVYNVNDIYVHSSFSNYPFGFVCKVNSDYHKLCKYFPMRDVEFDICFTIDGKKIIYTPEMDLLLLELSFIE
jgi:hypothetical protein